MIQVPCWLDGVLYAKEIRLLRLLRTLRASLEYKEKLNWDPNSAKGVYHTLNLKILNYFPWGKYMSVRVNGRNVIDFMASFCGFVMGVFRNKSLLGCP